MTSRPLNELYHTTLAVLGTLNVARSRGLDIDELMRKSGLNSAMLEHPMGTVPFGCAQRLFELVATLTNDPYLGLHHAEDIGPQDGGVAGYFLLAGDSGEELLRASYDHLTRVSNIFAYSISFDEPTGRLRLDPNIPIDIAGPQAESNFTTFVANNRRFLDPDFRPYEVRFVHGPVKDPSEYQRIFQCPVHFEQAIFEVTFDPAIGRVLPKTHDPQLRAALTPYVEIDKASRVAQLQPPTVLAVREQIQKLFDGDPPAAEQVAEGLGLRLRTLQHRLAQENTTYRGVLESVRKEMAIGAIRAGEAAQAVARRLGYRDGAAFHRAFRRWTGMTPQGFGESPVDFIAGEDEAVDRPVEERRQD